MGQGTALAQELLDASSMIAPAAMCAQLCVRDAATNRYFNSYATYGGGTYDHVELKLMQALYHHYNNNLQQVPNRSKIIVYSPWSPCTQCTRQTIPMFLGDMNAAARGISIKFVFAQYYTVSNYPNIGTQPGAGQTRWASDIAAQGEYDTLMGNSGIVARDYVDNGIPTEKVMPALQVKQYGSPSLSIRTPIDLTAFV